MHLSASLDRAKRLFRYVTAYIERYPWAAAALVALSLFLPMFVSGEVIAPLNQGRYIDPGYTSDGYRETHLLSDYISSFIPRASGQLSDDREAFIDLWDPSVEAGMPTIQLGATSKAFPVFLLGSLISDNPYIVLTLVCIISLVLAAVALTLFAREEGVSPAMALVVGLMAILSWRMTLWIAFPQYIYGLALTFLAMFLAERYIRTGQWLVLGWLPPVLYMILLGSRPAFTVAYAYIATAYVVLCLFRLGSARLAAQRMTFIAIAGILAVILALPNYIGLAATAAASLRASSPESFFLRGLHDISSLSSMSDWFVMLLNAWGWAVLPLFIVSFVVAARRPMMTFWLSAAMIPLLLSVTPGLYVYLIRYFGFNISIIDPSWFALGPVLIIIASGLQYLIETDENRLPGLILIAAFAICWSIVGLGVWPEALQGIRPELVIAGAISLGGATVAVWWRRKWLLLAALLVPAFFVTQEKLPTRPLELIRTTSPLFEAVSSNLEPGQRYVKTDGVVFSPRIVASLGVPTLHYIDSLSSEAANVHLAERFTGRPGLKLGRKFTHVHPRARACGESDYLRMLNVAVVIADRAIECENLLPIAVVQGHHLYRPKGDIHEVFFLEGMARAVSADEISLPESILLGAAAGQVTSRSRDALQVQAPGRANDADQSVNLLVLSQQYHSAWKASVAGRDLKTIRVNGFLLGVVMPADIDKPLVQLRFLPVTRWLSVSVWTVLFLSVFLAFAGMVSRWRRTSRVRLNHSMARPAE